MIIGLCGYARAGKDELAKALYKHHGFRRYAFADVLKEAALHANPWVRGNQVRLSDLVNSIGWEGAKVYPEVRAFLQRMGGGMRVVLGEDVWLDEVADRIFRETYQHVVITDVRYPNEADWVGKYGSLVRVERAGVGPVNGHESETAIDDVQAKYTVRNTGTLDELWAEAERLPYYLGATPRLMRPR